MENQATPGVIWLLEQAQSAAESFFGASKEDEEEAKAGFVKWLMEVFGPAFLQVSKTPTVIPKND